MAHPAPQHPQPQVAGEGGDDFVMEVAAYLLGAAKMAGYTALPLVAIGIDLYLSGAFMKDYSHQYGARGFIATWLPVIFTFATSGLQAAINARVKVGFRDASRFAKSIIVVGWFMIVLDTVTDIGGFTALYTENVDLGANVIPQGQAHNAIWWLGWWLGTIAVILVCGTQERLLPFLYGRWEKSADERRESEDGPGESWKRAGIVAGGYLFSWINNALKPIGLGSIVALDIVLAPSFLGALTSTPAAWVFTGVTTVMGWALWDNAREVAFARMPDNSLGWSKLTKGSKAIGIAGWLFALLDAVVDVLGYIFLVFGGHPVTTLNLIITVVIMFLIVFAGDALVQEVIRRPGRRRRGRGSRDPGAFAFGRDAGFSGSAAGSY